MSIPQVKDYTKPLKAVRIFDHTENEVRIFTHNNRVEPLGPVTKVVGAVGVAAGK